MLRYPWCGVRQWLATEGSCQSVIFGCNSRHHVTSLLRDHLHWLQARERISLKLCLQVYKAIHGLAPCYLNAISYQTHRINTPNCASQFRLFQTFLLSVSLLVVIWSYPERGYNSASGHFVWWVQSLGHIISTLKTCSRHIFYHVSTLPTVSRVRAANIVRRPCSDSSHVTAPYKLSFYYYCYPIAAAEVCQLASTSELSMLCFIMIQYFIFQ